MGKKEEDILCELRNRFLYYSGVSEDRFLTQSKAKTNERIYYLKKLNIILRKVIKNIFAIIAKIEFQQNQA